MKIVNQLMQFGGSSRFDKDKLAKIAVGILVIIVAAFVLSFLFTQGISDVAKNQLRALKNDDIESAYALTSTAFQADTSLDKFKEFVSKYPILKEFKRIRFVEKRVDDGTGYLNGQLIGEDGSKTKIEFQLTKEDKVWKIQAIRLSLGSIEDVANVDKSGAAIHQIFINDVADANGYTEEGKKTLSRKAEKIFVTVQVSTPSPGINVYASLIYLPGGGKIGPSSGEITKSGNVLKAFSFTRDSNYWPKGEYEIDVSLSTGATKSIKFTVD